MRAIYLSLSACGGQTTEELLPKVWALGIRGVELAIGPRPSPKTTHALQHFLREGLALRAHHAFVFEAGVVSENGL